MDYVTKSSPHLSDQSIWRDVAENCRSLIQGTLPAWLQDKTKTMWNLWIIDVLAKIRARYLPTVIHKRDRFIWLARYPFYCSPISFAHTNKLNVSYKHLNIYSLSWMSDRPKCYECRYSVHSNIIRKPSVLSYAFPSTLQILFSDSTIEKTSYDLRPNKNFNALFCKTLIMPRHNGENLCIRVSTCFISRRKLRPKINLVRRNCVDNLLSAVSICQ
jgi:hypothetical protein